MDAMDATDATDATDAKMHPELDVGTLFLRSSCGYLRDTYLPRIERALEILPTEDVWWSPHGATNAVGNLLLHLEGNVRQWLISGLGGAPDERQRSLEFLPESRPALGEMVSRLRSTVDEACDLVHSLPTAELEIRRRIQRYDTTVLEAIYHVVEHFSWHTGQITSIAKQRAGEQHGLAFYDEAQVNAARNEPGTESV